MITDASNKKQLMILGGGVHQIPLIDSAKNEGYITIVCDRTVNCPGAQVANKFFKVDIIDMNAILKIADHERVDGIISNSEWAMLSVAHVAETLQLVGNSVHSIEMLLSKRNFRDLQRGCGLFAPKYFEVTSLRELKNNIHNMKFPVIVKPSESSGTRGTTIIESCNSIADIEAAYKICKRFSRNSLVTVEEFVAMPSLSVIEGDIFVYNDEIIWDGLFLTRRSPLSPMLPMTYSLPLFISEKERNMIKETLRKLILNAGICHGQYNFEAYFTSNNELFVIEINARQGGNGIPSFIQAHCGVNMDKLLVTTALNDNHYFNELKTMDRECNFVVKHAVFPRNRGIYKNLYVSNQVKRYMVGITEFVRPGNKVDLNHNASDEICLVDLLFEDAFTQADIASRLEELVYPIIE